MHWIYHNVDHLTVPFGILFGVFAMVFGLATQRKRKRGETGPVFTRPVRLVAALILAAGLVFAGIVLSHTQG